jgi:hypothetical protein
VRKSIVVVFAFAPTAALAWMGCSSSSKNNGAPLVMVDPGGTFGAQIAVTVIGRGRVTTSVPGVDCPSSCYSSFVFTDRTTPAATAGVKLTAIPTKGIRFAGWKFDTIMVGGRGRGPDSCNPIQRMASAPPVDMNALEITIPYGESNGTPPAGQEALCAPYTAVPTAYQVTATFVDDMIDAGLDADGGGEVFLESPVANVTGKEIGISGGRLYWRYEQLNGASGIATASTSGIGGAQTIPSSTGFFGPLEIGTHVVWQTTSGTMGVIQGGSTFATTFSTLGALCVAVESDFSNVYCRTAGPNGTIVSWTTAGTTMTTVHSGLPLGEEMALDSTYFYLVDTTSGAGATTIKGVTRTATPDGGVPTQTDLVTGLTNPTGLEVSSSRLWWIDYDNIGGDGTAQSASRFGGTPFTSAPATIGLKVLGLDPNNTSAAFVGTVPSTVTGASTITKLSSSSTFVTQVRQNLTGVGGVAADSSYVYWTQSDGRVYRAQRTTF